MYKNEEIQNLILCLGLGAKFMLLYAGAKCMHGTWRRVTIQVAVYKRRTDAKIYALPELL